MDLAIIAIIGIGVVALPSGILASGFTDQLKRRQSKYEDELSKALQDGVITSSERSKLTKIAEDMNLSDDQIKTIPFLSFFICLIFFKTFHNLLVMQVLPNLIQTNALLNF